VNRYLAINIKGKIGQLTDQSISEKCVGETFGRRKKEEEG
jgi:hypothetical protein